MSFLPASMYMYPNMCGATEAGRGHWIPLGLELKWVVCCSVAARR